jgi:hypothetical protein
MNKKFKALTIILSIFVSLNLYATWTCQIEKISCKTIRLNNIDRYVLVEFQVEEISINKMIKVPLDTNEQKYCYDVIKSVTGPEDSFYLCQESIQE